MASSFETNKSLAALHASMRSMHCSINSLGDLLSAPGNGPVPPIKNFQTIKCCDLECKAVFVTKCFTTEIIYIPPTGDGGGEEPATTSKVKCGISSTVNGVGEPLGTYEIGETTETTTFTYADGSLFEGDPATLDPTCSLCLECNPEVQDVCLDEGATYIPFTSATIHQPKACCTVEIITSAGTFYLRKGMKSKCIGPFACPVTITSITIIDGPCEDEDVCIQLEASGCYTCGLS